MVGSIGWLGVMMVGACRPYCRIGNPAKNYDGHIKLPDCSLLARHQRRQQGLMTRTEQLGALGDEATMADGAAWLRPYRQTQRQRESSGLARSESTNSLCNARALRVHGLQPLC